MKMLTIFCFVIVCYVVTANCQVKVKLHSIEGYGQFEGFAKNAVEKLEKILNSQDFFEKVRDGEFSQTQGLNNGQVYQRILKAHEEKGPGGEDFVVDLRLRTIDGARDGKRWLRNCRLDSWAGTIGIDGTGDGVSAVCPERLAYFASTNDIASLTGHFAHEYLHTLGFSHSWPFKSHTAVYRIGDIVEELAKIDSLRPLQAGIKNN